jgi:ubiquinone biosynthesis protein
MDFATRSLTIGRRIRHMGRLAQITNTFARHGLWSLAERLGLKSQLTPEQVREAESLAEGTGVDESGAEAVAKGTADVSELQGLPARLRRSFEELGPAFVKLGQVLAVREDLLPRDYVEELRKLHHSVAALPYAAIRQVLETELGPEKLALFAEIDERPLAAGSIAQVHAARLKSGESVVVKVQRPGIDHQIRVDLNLMGELAALIERFIPETASARPVAMIQEFARGFLGELDFIREGGNIAKIGRNFQSVSHVVTPEVHWKLTTPRVLTMTRIDGLPAWDRDRIIGSGLEPSLLVERGLGMFLKMVFIDGLFHGDLHPGNLLALDGSNVGVIDFGLCVHLSKSTRENLAGLLIALMDEDFNRVVTHYVELAEPAATFDALAFEHEIGNAVGPFLGLSLEDLRSGRLFWDLAGVAARHGAPMPQELVIFIKTLVTFEGIGTNLDPGFDVLKASEKYTAEIVAGLYSVESLKQQGLTIVRDLGQLAKHGPFQVRRLLRSALEGSLSFRVRSDELDRLAVAVDRSSARLSVSAIVGALIIGSSILAYAHVGANLQSIPMVGLVGFSLAGLLGLYVIWSILRGK